MALLKLANRDIDSEYNLEGYNAYDSGGSKVGDIDGVILDEQSMQSRYLIVDSGGWFTSRQYVVPAGEIRDIDDGNRRVYFKTITKDGLKDGRYPEYNDEWWDDNNSADWQQHEQRLAQRYEPATTSETAAIDYSHPMYQAPREGANRLRLMEERLRIGKEREEAGPVRLGKRIVERTETVDVPVTSERVVIERRPVTDATPVDGDIAIGEGETIEVPVTQERVVVGKQAVVAEEVIARTEAVERTEQVRENLRREELIADGDQELVDGNAASAASGDATRIRRDRPMRDDTVAATNGTDLTDGSVRPAAPVSGNTDAFTDYDTNGRLRNDDSNATREPLRANGNTEHRDGEATDAPIEPVHTTERRG